MNTFPESFKIQRLHGGEAAPFIPELARLRIQVFREFPYLYDGNLAYEAVYLKAYTDCKNSVLVLAFDGARVIGVSTGLPLAEAMGEFAQPFLSQGQDVNRIFYFGESVLEKPYRGRGIGKRFFQEREAHAMALGGFETTCFCAVDRPETHPGRPADYHSLDAFWTKLGYQKRPDLSATLSWKELDETEESPKSMTFWVRSLPTAQ